MSDSVRPHRQHPTRLPCPWDSPGKNTGVGCHFLLQCRKEKSESEVAQSCPVVCNPMDCSLRGFSVRGIFQARVLGWGAIAFSEAFLDNIKLLANIILPINICSSKIELGRSFNSRSVILSISGHPLPYWCFLGLLINIMLGFK